MGLAVALIFAEEISPDDFYAVVESIGGEIRPDPYSEARLRRGESYVWVLTEQSGNLMSMLPDEAAEYEARLGAAPRQQIVLDLSDEEDTDRLAFEIIEAAAERWWFVVDNDRGRVYTVDEIRTRVAARKPTVFVDPGRRIVLLFGQDIDTGRLLDLVASLGGEPHPGSRIDAGVFRGRRRLWLSVVEDALMTLPVEDAARSERLLGAPPCASVTVYLSRDPGTDLVALEVIEAAAEHWRLVVDNDQGSVYTPAELRARASTGTAPLFWDDQPAQREDDEG